MKGLYVEVAGLYYELVLRCLEWIEGKIVRFLLGSYLAGVLRDHHLICSSFDSTRLICASFGSIRLICVSAKH